MLFGHGKGMADFRVEAVRHNFEWINYRYYLKQHQNEQVRKYNLRATVVFLVSLVVFPIIAGISTIRIYYITAHHYGWLSAKVCIFNTLTGLIAIAPMFAAFLARANKKDTAHIIVPLLLFEALSI